MAKILTTFEFKSKQAPAYFEFPQSKAKLNHHQSNFKVGSVKVVFDDKLQESRPNAKITFQNLLGVVLPTPAAKIG